MLALRISIFDPYECRAVFNSKHVLVRQRNRFMKQ